MKREDVYFTILLIFMIIILVLIILILTNQKTLKAIYFCNVDENGFIAKSCEHSYDCDQSIQQCEANHCVSLGVHGQTIEPISKSECDSVNGSWEIREIK